MESNKLLQIIDFIKNNKLLVLVGVLMIVILIFFAFNTNYNIVEQEELSDPTSYYTTKDYTVMRTKDMVVLEIRNKDIKDVGKLIKTLGLEGIENLVITYPGAISDRSYEGDDIQPVIEPTINFEDLDYVIGD